MAAAFRLIQAAILAGNLLNYFSAYVILSGVSAVQTLDVNMATGAKFYLELHSLGYDLGLIFFAISTAILGYLILKSNLFPALLGYGLLASAIVYFLGSYIHFLAPGWASVLEPAYLIPLINELAFCLWLLVKGVKLTSE